MTDCFTCPDPANYAAVALQLQQTAQQAETCLYTLETSLRAAVNPLSFVSQTTANATIPANIDTLATTAAGNILFTNMPLPASIVVWPWVTRPLGAGVWHIGTVFTAIATGAVTADSLRRTTIRVRKPAISTPVHSVTATQYEANNGTGVDITHSAILVLDDKNLVDFLFFHTNASSVNISTGARFFATKLSDQFNMKAVI